MSNSLRAVIFLIFLQKYFRHPRIDGENWKTLWVCVKKQRQKQKRNQSVACENIRFSSLFADGHVSREGTSATQRHKLHTRETSPAAESEEKRMFSRANQSGADKGKMLWILLNSQRILLENVLRSAWRNCNRISGLNFMVREENSGDKTTFLVLVFVGNCACCFFPDEWVKRACDRSQPIALAVNNPPPPPLLAVFIFISALGYL